MKIKRIILIFVIIIAMFTIINGVNALKIDYDDYNKPSNRYSDGVKESIYTKGYTYHNGKIHKHVQTKPNLRSYCYNEHNKKCKYYGRTTIGMWYVEGKVSEIKRVSHGSIKINGKYHNKKIKLYTDYERFDGEAKFPKFHPTNDIKGNLKGKTVTMSVHDKKGKILATKSFRVRTVNNYLFVGA
jgi:hypothetical protein